LVKGIIYLA